jgi:hypothetical protein
VSDHVLEDLEAYAFGTLDETTQSACARHLTTCERCRSELASIRAVADVLPLGLREEMPPLALRQRVLAATVAASPVRRRYGIVERGLAVALVIALVGIAALTSAFLKRGETDVARIAALEARSDGAHTSARAAARSQSIVAALSSGATYVVAGRVAGQTWRCTIVQPRGHADAFIVTRTPAAPAGVVYRAWVLRDGSYYHAGDLISSADNALEMPMGLRAGDVVGFSSETGPAAARPANPFLMTVAITS